MIKFVGRKQELKALEDLFDRGDARIAVIKGRRRVGKTALIREFAKGKRFLSFSGESPTEKTTEQSERDVFCKQLALQLGKPVPFFDWWMDIFYYLEAELTDEPTVVLFDEISWMASQDPSFIPQLKECWDRKLSQRSNFMLIFCGSISTWIEKNIIMSTSFYGRMSMRYELDSLTIPACARFLKYMAFEGDSQDIYRILSFTGGVPFYLEQINPKLTAKENMKEICFKKNGALVGEFDMIFHDLFNGDALVHKKILEILGTGRKLFSTIQKEYGDISDEELKKYLNNLEICGFVSEHGQYSLKTKKELNEHVYGLCDPYVNFYLRYIEPRRLKIKAEDYDIHEDPEMAGLDGIIGLAVEMLLIKNNSLIYKAVGAKRFMDCVSGPYHQKATPTRKACQIDYLIQDNDNHIYICEFKFSKNPVETSVIDAVKEKINRLDAPEGTCFLPVLFHIGGVSKEVKDAKFFHRMIDITEFIKGEDD